MQPVNAYQQISAAGVRWQRKVKFSLSMPCCGFRHALHLKNELPDFYSQNGILLSSIEDETKKRRGTPFYMLTFLADVSFEARIDWYCEEEAKTID